jgi:hypothetical protein
MGIAALRFLPAPGYGDKYYGLYLNGVKRAHVFADEGKYAGAQFPVYEFANPVGVFIEDMGDWADPFYDFDANAIDQEAVTSENITIFWEADPEIDEREIPGGTTLTNWDMTGFKRFTNCEKDQNNPTWGTFTITMRDTVGMIAQLYAGGQLIATGTTVTYTSFPNQGTIHFTEENSSGVSGTVDFNFGGTEVTYSDFCRFTVRWPKQYEIHWSTSSLSFPPDPATL